MGTGCGGEIGVILDRDTYRTIGVQFVECSGGRMACALGVPTINEFPADREELLSPELSGYRLEDWGRLGLVRPTRLETCPE